MALTERGIGSLAPLQTTLRSVSIGSTGRMATVVDATLHAVAALTALTHLDLSGCVAITDAGLRAVGGLTGLRALSLWNCLRVTDEGLDALLPLQQLRSLSLRGCQQLGDVGLSRIAGLRAMQQLDLRACERITGALVDDEIDIVVVYLQRVIGRKRKCTILMIIFCRHSAHWQGLPLGCWQHSRS